MQTAYEPRTQSRVSYEQLKHVLQMLTSPAIPNHAQRCSMTPSASDVTSLSDLQSARHLSDVLARAVELHLSCTYLPFHQHMSQLLLPSMFDAHLATASAVVT